ncbi:MAG: IMP dehydrogenase [Planctomycetaceae bacterium]|nr:IMP dehydrogenase [Planctomycetaceae bacterium]
MSIRVALHHKTSYSYDRLVNLAPHIVRLRPAVHCRTPVLSYSLRVTPEDHFLNWQQDPYGNFLARCVFPEKTRELAVEIDLIAEMSSINPFDFFLEPDAEEYPWSYDADSLKDLQPYLALSPVGQKFYAMLGTVDRTPRRTIDFLVELNQRLQREIKYLVRMEPGVQTPEQTLELGSGSCRDSAWLLVQLLRHLGFAARFASGYLIQLTADVKPLEGPEGPQADFTDLHAWTEVYLPGAGWVGLDPTSGLLTGEGHLPLACTPSPISAAPITGAHDQCEVSFDFAMNVERVYEDPRVTKPYTEQQWQRIESLGHEVDRQLDECDVRLTMGGEPTFVSIDDMDGEEWQTAASGPTKRRFARDMMQRLKTRFAPGGLLHHGQGKWYPGESLPRWAMHCFWRLDGEPVWRNPDLFADVEHDYGHTADDAMQFSRALAERLGVNPDHAIHAYEDGFYYAWRERRLPANVDFRDPKVDEEEERTRIARVFEQGLSAPVGTALPLQYRWWEPTPHWASGAWVVRSAEMFLTPGDSPMGYRLPLQSLLYTSEGFAAPFYEQDPLLATNELSRYDQLRQRRSLMSLAPLGPGAMGTPAANAALLKQQKQLAGVGGNGTGSGYGGYGEGDNGKTDWPDAPAARSDQRGEPYKLDTQYSDAADVVRTALCVEPREGRLHVFLPPTDRLEVFLDLIAAIEDTAESLDKPVVIEGYLPPHDSRLQHIKITPDPGVLEVNVHPAHNWGELVDITTGVYDDAHQTRLGTEKFDLDGSHTGTGGGNHVVIGGPTPADSPWLRRPDLLKSFVGYWHNHPSLSYLFSGKFIGPTSQAPRIDEGRSDAIYELKIAFEQVQAGRDCPPWMVDRVFRHLLVDLTGNTHRSEFCIDKLFSPDSSSGRLGLVEFRAFEMPPHARMSLTQQLLIRTLVARFWQHPYTQPLVDWQTTLHDRWVLPHFVWQDFQEVVEHCQDDGYDIQPEWFAPHFEFRFPVIGEFNHKGVQVEVRRAIEPWYVLGEEPGGGYMARYVDSSVERVQVRTRGMTSPRFALTCNGRRVPLHPTGAEGEFVAGVRFRAWQPPSCLHPTLGVDGPLTFDLIDQWNGRAVGGCQYHVGHPGGINPSTFPVNALEAESRRAMRFFAFGHTGGSIETPPMDCSPEFPHTLDLRRGKATG